MTGSRRGRRTFGKPVTLLLRWSQASATVAKKCDKKMKQSRNGAFGCLARRMGVFLFRGVRGNEMWFDGTMLYVDKNHLSQMVLRGQSSGSIGIQTHSL